jgi:hypothetical protein
MRLHRHARISQLAECTCEDAETLAEDDDGDEET